MEKLGTGMKYVGLMMPGALVGLAGASAPAPYGVWIMIAGLLIAVALPVFVALRSGGNEIVPGTNMKRREWEAEKARRRMIVGQFAHRFRGVAGISFDEARLNTLAGMTGTEELWIALTNAIQLTDVHERNTAARQAIGLANSYSIE